MKKYKIELIWNREFNWHLWGELYDSLESAKKSAVSLRDSGDGARVKKIRILDDETDIVVWNG